MYIYAVGIGKRIRATELTQLAGHSGDYSRVANFKEVHAILESLKRTACGMIVLLLFYTTREIAIGRSPTALFSCT